MGKPTYDELFKKYLRIEEDREELIFECDWLHDKMNKAIELLEDLQKDIFDSERGNKVRKILDILKRK